MKYALRMDDVGASSKQFERYSRIPGGNFLGLKSTPFFRAWGPYRELTCPEWGGIFMLLREFHARLTVAVTAAWVEEDGALVPFPEKYPAQAEGLRSAEREGIIEIANHGLTHCIVGEHRPRLFTSNRRQHREFWPLLGAELHEDHLRRSQSILTAWLGHAPVVLVPPGNVFSPDTVFSAARNGIGIINCRMDQGVPAAAGVVCLGDEQVVPFHDRELVLYGVSWLRKLLSSRQGESVFVRQLI